MTDVITVTIRNWAKKYNKHRKEIVHPYWFAVANKILRDFEMKSLSRAELLAWLYIMSLASEKKSPIVSIIWADVDTHAHWFSREDLVSAVKKLGQLGVIEAHFQEAYEIRTASAQDLHAKRALDKTENRKEQTETDKAAIEIFEKGFDQKSLDEVKAALEFAFDGKVPPDLMRAKARILYEYGTPEHFRECLDEIINQDGADETNPKRRSYIAVSLKKQMGWIEDASKAV